MNTLISAKKYKDAEKLIEKIEKTKLTVDYADEIKIIKDVNSEEETNEEEAEYKQELNELETLEEQDKKINS